jgi:hypothetical protein
MYGGRVVEDPKLRRIQFELDQDANAYPPAAVETLWSIDLGDGSYELNNIPFFAKEVSLGDVVEVDEMTSPPTFVRVIRRGGHATLRVIVFDAQSVQHARRALVDLGATTELSHLPRLFAIDVPPAASLAAIRAFLAEGAAAVRWDWEESDVPG